MKHYIYRGCLGFVLFAYFFHLNTVQSICYYNSTSLIPRDNITANELVKVVLKKDIPSRIAGRKQLIPYIIHQTNERDEVPSDMAMAIESLVEYNPEYAYRYYNETERRQFLKEHMGKTVLACYDKLNPNAFKADLFRYSVVYTYGGCYLDIGIVAVANLRSFIRATDTFVSTPDGLPPHVNLNSATFCSTAKNPILDVAIRRLVKRVANSQYGHDMLDITGPWILRKGFSTFFKDPSLEIVEKEYCMGVRLEGLQLNPECRVNRLTYGSNRQTMVLTKYPRYSEDVSIHLPKMSYPDAYNNKLVFNESVKVQSDGNYSLDPTEK